MVHRVVAPLATHAPKLLLLPQALNFSEATYFGRMVKQALPLLGMTQVELEAHENRRRQRLREGQARQAALRATAQGVEES